jgi:thiamine biosynthesis lipoprotein
MYKYLFIIPCFIILTLSSLQAQTDSYARVLNLMGSRFEVKALAENQAVAQQAVEKAITEITRIEALISSWDSTSQTSLINRNAGIRPVKINLELFELIQRSFKVSQLTGGAFDISYASADRIWKFDGSMTALPSEEAIAQSVARIGYQKIILNQADTTVFLPQKGMKIGFGAIGKGYAANQAQTIMQENGAIGGLVNAGGDLTCWGQSPDPKGWKIGIANPKNRERLRSWIYINEMAVVTSGDYEKFFIVEGQKYAHIIHPGTGYPAQGLQSVSIFCPNAELADALATAVFVMGEKEGMNLINQLNGIECLMINQSDEIIHSKNLSLNHYSNEQTHNQTPHQLIIGKKKP